MGFQTKVNLTQAPAVEGDFASSNPRSTVLAGPGGLVTGLSGVRVARFGWVEADFRTTNNFADGPVKPDGFVHRDQQALITQFLGESSMVVPEGFPITLHKSGDFWAKNLGPSVLTKGVKVYAGYADGGIYSAAPTGFSGDGSIGSTNTASLGSTNTASIGSTSTGTVVAGQPSQITLSAVTGLVSIGDTITAGDASIPVSTEITGFISGTEGGAGVYSLSNDITSAAATIHTFGTVLKVTATTGLISVGDFVSGGAGFPLGASIAADLTGGLWSLNLPATDYVASATGVTTFGSVMKVTATTGLISIGDTVSGGAGFPVDATVTGNPSAGLWTLSAAGTAYTASASGVTTFGEVLNVDTVTSGILAPGQAIATGSGIPATSIESQVSGALGGIGVYTLFARATAYVASEAFTTVGGIETDWIAEPTNQGDGDVGSLVKITRFA